MKKYIKADEERVDKAIKLSDCINIGEGIKKYCDYYDIQYIDKLFSDPGGMDSAIDDEYWDFIDLLVDWIGIERHPSNE